MKCSRCGADMEEGVTTNVVDLENIVIIVRHVPCWQCTECGEELYSWDVTKRLEEITAKTKDSLSEIAVIDYKKAA